VPRLVLRDLANHGGLIGFKPILALALPAQEDETGLVVRMVLYLGSELGAAIGSASQLVADGGPGLCSRCHPFDCGGGGVAASTSRPGGCDATRYGIGRSHEDATRPWSPGPGSRRNGQQIVPDGVSDFATIWRLSTSWASVSMVTIPSPLSNSLWNEGAIDLARGDGLDSLLIRRAGHELALAAIGGYVIDGRAQSLSKSPAGPRKPMLFAARGRGTDSEETAHALSPVPRRHISWCHRRERRIPLVILGGRGPVPIVCRAGRQTSPLVERWAACPALRAPRPDPGPS